jgi:hypothetical protein
MRYELHRVWVVEATSSELEARLRQACFLSRRGQLDGGLRGRLRHAQAALARGRPPLIQFYDAKVPWYRANIWHDLSNGSYLLSLLDNEIKTPWLFDQKARWADFQPDALRRAGTK